MKPYIYSAVRGMLHCGFWWLHHLMILSLQGYSSWIWELSGRGSQKQRGHIPLSLSSTVYQLCLHTAFPRIKTSLVQRFTSSFPRSEPIHSGLSDRFYALLCAGSVQPLHVCAPCLQTACRPSDSFKFLQTEYRYLSSTIFVQLCQENRYYTIFHFLP